MEPKELERTIVHYSIAFKRKVVEEIESGKLTISGARRLYGIGGNTTIQKWIRKLGKLQLINKVIRVELKDEISKLKQLEREKKELESALAQAHLKLLTYESLIEIAEEDLGVDLKKNIKFESLSLPGKKAKQKGRRRK